METGQAEIVTDSAKPEPRKFKGLLFIGRLLVAAGLLYLILRMVSPGQILSAFRSASLSYIIIGASLVTINIWSRVIKWRYMLRIVKDESSWWESFTSVLLGITLGSFTPGQLGELGGRTMRVNHSKSSHVVGLTLVDRTQVFLVTAMTGSFSCAFFITADPLLAIGLGLVSAMICLYLYFRLDLIKSIADRIHLKIMRHQWIDGIVESFTFIGKDHILSTLMYSCAFFAIITLQMYFFINAFTPVSFWHVYLGFASMMFVKSIFNISISDIGIREVSTVYFFSILGVPQAAALNASILMFTVNVIIPSLLGVLFLPKLRIEGRFNRPRGSNIDSAQ